MKNSNRKKYRGFSIGEVMVAAFILLFGIVSAIFLTGKSLVQMGDGQNAIIASMLAQEGTELVRNVRDNSVTQMTCGAGNDERCTAFEAYGWPSWTNARSPAAKCHIDSGMDGSNNNLNCESNQTDNTLKLYVNEDTFAYTHSGGGNSETDSYFKRAVFIRFERTDGSSSQPVTLEDKNKMVAYITSVVVWGGKSMLSSGDVSDISDNCKIGGKCAFSQTKLTSWINYGD